MSLESAIAAHRAGRLVEARGMYERIVRDRPEQADVWNLLGTLARQESRPSEAIEYISRAIELNPKSLDHCSKFRRRPASASSMSDLNLARLWRSRLSRLSGSPCASLMSCMASASV